VVFAVAMAAIGIDARGIWESDEGRYTAVPVEMLRSGDLLTPRLNLDAPHLTKPPLTYWSVAASFAAFGPSELAARLPNLLAFVLTVLVVLRLGRRLVPEKPWLPALVYATLPVTVLGANVVTTDTLLTLFEALAVLCFLERRHAVMWLAFGLGFLTKGPPALLPLLAIVTLVKLRDAPLRPLFPPLGLAAFAGVGLGWFAFLIAREPALAGYFLGDEVIARIATDAHDRNAEWYAPFTVYLPVLVVGMLPWALAALPTRRALAERAAVPYWRARFAERPELGFLALWFLLPLGVFCFAQSRQPGYLLPLFVPLALMLGRALAPRFDGSRAGWRAFVLLAAALPLAIKLWLPHWPYYKDSRGLAAHVATEFAPAADDRILFLGRWPQWGLRVYQPARVGWREADQPICDALAPAPSRTLVIVWNKRPADLAGALAACGRGPARRLAPFRDMDLYAVE
jgi:4-amino-4-deoxy-L-arabinose transferase